MFIKIITLLFFEICLQKKIYFCACVCVCRLCGNMEYYSDMKLDDCSDDQQIPDSMSNSPHQHQQQQKQQQHPYYFNRFAGCAYTPSRPYVSEDFLHTPQCFVNASQQYVVPTYQPQLFANNVVSQPAFSYMPPFAAYPTNPWSSPHAFATTISPPLSYSACYFPYWSDSRRLESFPQTYNNGAMVPSFIPNYIPQMTQYHPANTSNLTPQPPPILVSVPRASQAKEPLQTKRYYSFKDKKPQYVVSQKAKKKRRAPDSSLRRTHIKQHKTTMRRSLVIRVGCALVRHILGSQSDFHQESITVSAQLAEMFKTNHSKPSGNHDESDKTIGLSSDIDVVDSSVNFGQGMGYNFEAICVGLVPLTGLLLEAITKYESTHTSNAVDVFSDLRKDLEVLIPHYSKHQDKILVISPKMCMDVRGCFYAFVVCLLTSMGFDVQQFCILENCVALLTSLAVDISDDTMLITDLQSEYDLRFMNKYKLA